MKLALVRRMNTNARFVLLAAVDDSPAADLVLQHVARMAHAAPGAEIHVLHVPVRFTHAPITKHTFDLDAGRHYLEAALSNLQSATSVRAIGHLVEREPVHAILQVATSIDADMIIVGSHDHHGPARWILGSVAHKVAERAPCAVLVARPKVSDAVSGPEIEPPCPQCLEAQRASKGKQLWCARHSEHHPHGHLHYEMPEGYGAGSNLISVERS